MEKLARLARHGVRRDEELSARGFQRIVKPAGDAVGRAAVGEHLGVDDLRIAARLVVLVGQHLARIGLPCVVHRHERRILRHHEFHGIRPEAAVPDQAHVGLPGGNGARTAAHGLEIVVGDAADGRHGRKYRRGHAVAAGDVLRAAFGIEPGALEGEVAQVDGVEIVAARRTRDEFHAGVERMLEPQRPDIVVGHRQEQLDIVVGTHLGEGAGRIARRGDHKDAILVFGGTPADRISLGLLERTGRHRGADGRIVTVERDPEVFQPEVGGKPLAFVGDGRRGALEDTPHGHPVAEPVKTVFGGFHFELPAGIFRADERGRLALRIGEHPARVLELTPRSDTFERVGGRCKIFHLYAFV